ncbi:MAG: glycosyl transferase family 2 [Actinomycetia bacterium]|nr:glycosyl transferase family 2 [Actinomycetes bacterium]
MTLRNPALMAILQCPSCAAALQDLGDELLCGSGHRFPVVQGVPVFTSAGRDVEVRPDDHISNPPPADGVALQVGSGGPWLHIGAGQSEARLDHCIEVETAIFRHTDLVANGAALPIRTASLYGCLAVNVFEHLREPDKTVAELARTIVPGGWVDISTAFLQPLHADPGHYFNVTDLGLREWFSDFDIATVAVPYEYHPALALGWQVSDLLFWSPPHLRERLGKLTLDEIADFWRDPPSREKAAFQAFMEFPEARKRILAAGFRLIAQSPGVRTASDELPEI